MQPKIVSRYVSQLTESKNNARLHDDAQIDQICNSINEFGFTNPLLITKDNRIIAGHGRFEAAQKLGLSRVPCIVLQNLSDVQMKAYALADNKLALNAKWNFELLSAELTELKAEDFDIELVGFDLKELNDLIGESSSESSAKKSTTVTGDRFLLMVEFETEGDCSDLFTELDERGFECKILT